MDDLSVRGDLVDKEIRISCSQSASEIAIDMSK